MNSALPTRPFSPRDSLQVAVPLVPGQGIFFRVDTRYSNCAQGTTEGKEGRESHPGLPPALGGGPPLGLPLFFSAAGVLKGARCGSESHGREELGEGGLKCWDGLWGDRQNSTACPRVKALVGRGPDRSFYLPEGSGKVGPAFPGEPSDAGGELLGQLPQQHHPGNLIPEPPATMPSALPTM